VTTHDPTPPSLRDEMQRLSTEELTSILRNRDVDEWRPEAFEVAAAILVERGVSPEDVEALGPEGFDVVEGEPTLTLETLTSPADAQLLRMALQEAGITAWVVDESLGSMYGVGIGSRLQVRAKDEAAAREILKSTPAPSDALPPELAEPACPACGSRNVLPETLPRGESRDADPRPSGGSLTRSRWQYVCSDCREAWPA
jgi:DNA-directed RNA polymerase subunit RPC12/RpoP